MSRQHTVMQSSLHQPLLHTVARSLPPSVKSTRRTAIVTTLLLAIGSLVFWNGMANSDWTAPSTAPHHFRTSRSMNVNMQLRDPNPPPKPPQQQTLREFYKQRARTLSDDQRQVVEMMQYAWNAYIQYGEHADMLDVVHQKGATFFSHDMAFTLVDSLDTLFVMGLHDEFDDASAWMKDHLRERIIHPGALSFFETTIRSLGGLLSAYYLSGESHILELADVLGGALTKAFTGGRSVPRQYIDLQSGEGYGSPCLAEASSFQLEFAYLAHATGKHEYLKHVESANAVMLELTRSIYHDGLIPVQSSSNWASSTSGSRSWAELSFGGLGDSYYEYLLKQWLLTGKQDEQLKQSYLLAINGMKTKLLGHTTSSNLTFVGQLEPDGELQPIMQHLTCFVPGMLALGTYHGLPGDHLELAKQVMETCVQMYLRAQTKLSPESVHLRSESLEFQDEMFAVEAEDYNILRPETVESLMVLYRVTKDAKYRDYGRIIMNAFEKHSKVASGGYRDTRHVFIGKGITTNGNNMESFFLAETLKYLFLLFSDDDILPLDTVVFNTEAHPMPVLPLLSSQQK